MIINASPRGVVSTYAAESGFYADDEDAKSQARGPDVADVSSLDVSALLLSNCGFSVLGCAADYVCGWGTRKGGREGGKMRSRLRRNLR